MRSWQDSTRGDDGCHGRTVRCEFTIREACEKAGRQRRTVFKEISGFKGAETAVWQKSFRKQGKAGPWTNQVKEGEELLWGQDERPHPRSWFGTGNTGKLKLHKKM